MPTRRNGHLRVMSVVGSRPDCVKSASLMKAFAATGAIESVLVHTGRDDKWAVKDGFLRHLAIPRPDFHLGVGPNTDAVETAETMTFFERMMSGRWRSDAVVVFGDANSTIACALVAAKLRIPVVRVEAGVRSGDRSKREINRVMTDTLSDLLFCTEQADVDNLAREHAAPAGRCRSRGSSPRGSATALRPRSGSVRRRWRRCPRWCTCAPGSR